jgi:hypothetical protein
MKDKLLVEINLNNGEIDDAMPALVFLTNELYESGVFSVSNPVEWNEKKGNDYNLKWRFAEDELSQTQIPLDIDFLYQLNETLKRVTNNIPENSKNTIEDLQTRLASYIEKSPFSLFADAY